MASAKHVVLGIILIAIVVGGSYAAYEYLAPYVQQEKPKKSGTNNETLNHAPIAVIYVDNTEVKPGEQLTYKVGDNITFDANNSYDPDEGDKITYFEWSFGDGSKSNNATVVKSYAKEGLYTVTLMVRDTQMSSNTTSIMIEIKPQDVYQKYSSIVHKGIIIHNFENYTQNFTVNEGFVNITVELTLTGISAIDGGAAKAEIILYDPLLNAIGQNTTTILGQKKITYFYDEDDDLIAGDYMITINCLSGTIMIDLAITIRY